MPVDRAYFDKAYANDPDPWRLRSSWYEARKRAVLLAALPKPTFRRAFEPGCATGELTVELATRARSLLALDLHFATAQTARQRLAAQPHVVVGQGEIPRDWPDGTFDLIVLSELGYYFEEADWAQVAALVANALTADGTLLACHWRHSFAQRRIPTDTVHGTLANLPGMHSHVQHLEPDFALDVWSRRPDSVATLEGLG